MNSYFVYILQCFDGLTYTGITNNISRRVEEHNKGLNKSGFTYKRRPVTLIFQQEFNDVNQAIYFEKKIKKWSSKKKLALAKGDDDLLKLLAQCRNESHSKNIGLDSARPDNISKLLLEEYKMYQ
jgi:putative endonuclease